MSTVYAFELTPIKVSQLNPFVISSNYLPTHVWKDRTDTKAEFDVRLEVGNFSLQSESSSEKIILDGEVYKSTLDFWVPLPNRLIGRISIPFILYSSGFMDNGIERWHDWFGFSNEQRSHFASNQLHFEYMENNVTQLKVISSTRGLGDINLGLSYEPQQGIDDQTGVAINLDLKLPSGDADRLLGNGATDLGLSVHLIKNTLGEYNNFSLTGGLGVVFMGESELLHHRQEDISYSAYAGLHWMLTHKLLLSTQLHQQASLFNSSLNELGKEAIQLIVGCSVQMESGQNFQIALGENLFTDASPDFSVLVSMQFSQKD